MVQSVPSDITVHVPENPAVDKVNEVAKTHPVDSPAKHVEMREEGKHHGNDDQRYGAPPRVDRRTYCRRIYHWPVLVELRSLIDRRRHDPGGETGHVDEEV